MSGSRFAALDRCEAGIEFDSEVDSDNGTVRWSRFSDLVIAGSDKGIGIDVVSADQVIFENVTVRDFETCWRFRPGEIRTVCCQVNLCRAINPVEVGFWILPQCRGLLFRQCRAENNAWKLGGDARGLVGWFVEGRKLRIGDGHRFEMCETEDAWLHADIVLERLNKTSWIGGGPGTNLAHEDGRGRVQVKNCDDVAIKFDRDVLMLGGEGK